VAAYKTLGLKFSIFLKQYEATLQSVQCTCKQKQAYRNADLRKYEAVIYSLIFISYS